MSDSSSPQKIQRFVPTQWLTEVRVQETNTYTHHYYEAQPLARVKLDTLHDTPTQTEKSQAATETAHLQAQINAKRKNKPISLMSDKRDIVGHTAFLQHQIDLRRQK